MMMTQTSYLMKTTQQSLKLFLTSTNAFFTRIGTLLQYISLWLCFSKKSDVIWHLFALCIFRREETVSKVVEFKFLQKLVVLLDIEGKQLRSSPTDSAAAVESPSAGAMETDKGLDLEQILKHLLAIEENSERSSTKQQSMIRVLAKCLELVWKYNIYQVRITALHNYA